VNERTATVDLGDDQLVLLYDADAVKEATAEGLGILLAVDAKYRHRHEGRGALGDSAERDYAHVFGTIRSLSLLLVSWNVEGEDGEPIPPDFEHLSALPLATLSAIAEAVSRDVFREAA